MDLETLKERVEKMEKLHQIEVLRILQASKYAQLSENANGVFINMSDLSPATIEKIRSFSVYVDEQLQNLDEMEEEKQRIASTFFCEKDKSKRDKATSLESGI